MLKVIKTTPDNIYLEAARKLVSVIIDKINTNQRISVFLSGGSCVNLYSRLADWLTGQKDIGGNLAFAQVDERFQPQDQVESRKYNVVSRINTNINAEAIGESGLWRICKKLRIPYYLISQVGLLDKAADEYNQRLEQLFREYDYKIAVLGIGEDGHTAGLLPGYEKDWNLDRYIVGYNLGQNNARALFCQQKFRQRVTVTPKLLKKLDYALIVAIGEKKRKAVEKLLRENIDTDFARFPAAVIRNITDVDLYTNLNL